MARQGSGSVRMGPISLFALVILLCIAVMGMLAASTGHAALASAQKQADNITDVYSNETKAWKLISQLDEKLSEVRSYNGGRWLASEEARELAEDMGNVTVKDGVIDAEFSSGDGKKLEVQLVVNSDATLTIKKWSVYTERDTDNGDVLWSGANRT